MTSSNRLSWALGSAALMFVGGFAPWATLLLQTFTGLTLSAGWGLYLTLAASVSLLLSSLALVVPGRPAPAVDPSSPPHGNVG